LELHEVQKIDNFVNYIQNSLPNANYGSSEIEGWDLGSPKSKGKKYNHTKSPSPQLGQVANGNNTPGIANPSQRNR